MARALLALIMFIFKITVAETAYVWLRDMKSSGQLDVWRVKCVPSLKNPQMEEMAASIKGTKNKHHETIKTWNMLEAESISDSHWLVFSFTDWECL